MAAIDELIQQIADPVLRERIRAEVEDLSKQKKFGLVFENHLPEHTPLYEMPIKVGSLVMPKLKKGDELFTVKAINGDNAIVVSKVTGEESELPLRSLVVAAELGEPIYPYLKYVDSISRAPDDDLWHILIEADNYHALQLLEYLYAGKVDCIYIDPPYNTGARDWKYNNRYVDGSDAYRHSKWLSMIEKRLRIAKKLLNPFNSVLIVTIDEKEYLHLGCLLEEIFPDARMQMVSSVISFKGSARKQQFTRLDEYIFFLEFGEASVQRLPLNDDWRMNPDDERATHLTWKYLIRSGGAGLRERSPGNFYPIFFTEDGKYHSVGEPLAPNQDRGTVIPPAGTFAVYPIDTQGREHYWNINRDKFLEYKERGYIKFGKPTKNGVPVTFLTSGEIVKVEQGIYQIEGYAEDGSIISTNEVRDIMPGTQWRIKTHDATRHGTDLLTKFLTDRQFPYPKSLYAVHDAINFFVADKPDALILDFFAGSGTTLHAVNLLNAEDGGHRRCIMVTNNEVSEEEAKRLALQGHLPGDAEWEKLGIARYVTWPRTVTSVSGNDIKGNPIKGLYFGGDLEINQGFRANVVFYQLGFLDKNNVSLGRAFRELLPLIWMKSGCHSKCPSLPNEQSIPSMMVLPENHLGILIDESNYDVFVKEVGQHPEIDSVFIVTNSDIGYQEMAMSFEGLSTYQLYRDYLDSFRLNVRK